MSGSSSIRVLSLIGDGVTAALLEEAGILTLADIWDLDMQDATIVRRLHDAAERLCTSEQYRGCQWDLLLVHAYNRLIVVSEADRVDPDVPHEFRCAISYQWTEDAVRTPAGHVYDRRWIERWIRSTGTDPCTRAPLSVQDLTPDPVLQGNSARTRSDFEKGVLPRHQTFAASTPSFFRSSASSGHITDTSPEVRSNPDPPCNSSNSSSSPGSRRPPR